MFKLYGLEHSGFPMLETCMLKTVS